MSEYRLSRRGSIGRVPFSSSKGRACANPVRFLKTQCSFMHIISKSCEEVCTKFATKCQNFVYVCIQYKIKLGGFLYVWSFFTHSVRHCSPLGRVMSIALRPVTSSKRTTPNEYTSNLLVTCPCCVYSGAKYLPPAPAQKKNKKEMKQSQKSK
jgi:hypothetical protein